MHWVTWNFQFNKFCNPNIFSSTTVYNWEVSFSSVNCCTTYIIHSGPPVSESPCILVWIVHAPSCCTSATSPYGITHLASLIFHNFFVWGFEQLSALWHIVHINQTTWHPSLEDCNLTHHYVSSKWTMACTIIFDIAELYSKSSSQIPVHQYLDTAGNILQVFVQQDLLSIRTNKP